MLSLSTAKQLREAGLHWMPTLHDFFVVPERGLDDKVFVISDMFTYVEWLRGQLAVTFHGSVEWALDHVLVADLVWMPTEAQLRDELEKRLATERHPAVQLTGSPQGYTCEIRFRDRSLCFEASEASDAYAAALLHVLRARPDKT